jgi:hypothetical protein
VAWIASTINGCTALERVVLGANFGAINYWAFEGNVNCKVYDFSRCLQIPTIDLYDDPMYSVFSDMPDDCKMLVPPHLLDEWKRATNWTVFADHIVAAESVADNGTSDEVYNTTEERLEAIEGNVEKVYEAGEEKYKGYKIDLAALIDRSITEIEIPKGIKEINSSAFANCTKLERISIPEGVESIGSSVFQNTAITELVLPESCYYLHGYALYGMTKLISVKLGNTTYVTTTAFNNNPNCLTYDFTRCTDVPQLSGANAFENINSEAKILVPATLYDKWIATTNWVVYKDYIVAA